MRDALQSDSFDHTKITPGIVKTIRLLFFFFDAKTRVESWPWHPPFTNNQAFIQWWMARPRIITIPIRATHGQVNLSPRINFENNSQADSELTPELREVVELIGESEIGDEIDGTTDHAWLVVLGHFAQALDLVAKLEDVSLSQRQGANGKPQSKIIPQGDAKRSRVFGRYFGRY